MRPINIELSDIIDYVGFRKRPWKEGEAVFKAGHVFLCCFSDAGNNKILALCIRSTQITASPHEINIKLSDCVKDWLCQCSCKAGESGYCKHIIATLIHMNRATSSVVNAIPEVSAASFKKQQIEKVFANVAHSEFLRELNCRVPDDLRLCCKNIISKLSMSNALEIAYNTVQGSNTWMKERKLRITGSRCYGIFTYTGDSNAWEWKAMKYFCPKGFSTKETEHGKTEEKNALQAYITTHNCEILQTSLIISNGMPWIGYSPDGIVFKNGEPSHLIEIKCPYLGKFNPPEVFIGECQYLDTRDNRLHLKEKHSYYAQVQLGMAVLNLKSTDFIVYSSYSKTFVCITVPFNKDFAQDLICTVSKNYFQHMLHVACKHNLTEEL